MLHYTTVCLIHTARRFCDDLQSQWASWPSPHPGAARQHMSRRGASPARPPMRERTPALPAHPVAVQVACGDGLVRIYNFLRSDEPSQYPTVRPGWAGLRRRGRRASCCIGTAGHHPSAPRASACSAASPPSLVWLDQPAAPFPPTPTHNTHTHTHTHIRGPPTLQDRMDRSKQVTPADVTISALDRSDPVAGAPLGCGGGGCVARGRARTQGRLGCLLHVACRTSVGVAGWHDRGGRRPLACARPASCRAPSGGAGPRPAAPLRHLDILRTRSFLCRKLCRCSPAFPLLLQWRPSTCSCPSWAPRLGTWRCARWPRAASTSAAASSPKRVGGGGGGVDGLRCCGWFVVECRAGVHGGAEWGSATTSLQMSGVAPSQLAARSTGALCICVPCLRLLLPASKPCPCVHPPPPHPAGD